MKENQVLCGVTGKSGYISFKFAERKLREMLRDGAYETQKGFKINIYRCTLCGYFHVGNNMKKGKVKKRDFNDSEWDE
jgi:hypothetical protein